MDIVCLHLGCTPDNTTMATDSLADKEIDMKDLEESITKTFKLITAPVRTLLKDIQPPPFPLTDDLIFGYEILSASNSDLLKKINTGIKDWEAFSAYLETGAGSATGV